MASLIDLYGPKGMVTTGPASRSIRIPVMPGANMNVNTLLRKPFKYKPPAQRPGAPGSSRLVPGTGPVQGPIPIPVRPPGRAGTILPGMSPVMPSDVVAGTAPTQGYSPSEILGGTAIGPQEVITDEGTLVPADQSGWSWKTWAMIGAAVLGGYYIMKK